MSVPIIICRFRKAMTDQVEFASLASDMAYNFSQPAYSILKCNHTPQCPPLNKDEETDIKRRIFMEIDRIRKQPNSKHIY